MSKKVITLVMATAFVVGSVGAAMATKYAKCKVTAVDGKTITLECSKNASMLKSGMKVKVKNAKRKAVEGC